MSQKLARLGSGILFLLIASAAGPGALAALPAPDLEADTDVATAGFYRLSWSWSGPADVEFQVQESGDPDFREAHTLYKGGDLATMQSGRDDGRFFYRVRAVGADSVGPWSQSVGVTVEHHPLSRAAIFFAVGAVVFVATLGLIVGGNRRALRGG